MLSNAYSFLFFKSKQNLAKYEHRSSELLIVDLLEQVMLACGKYNLVHDFFKKVQKSFIPNALIYKGKHIERSFEPITS